MAKFKQMNKSELLKLVTEVSTSLKTIGAAELSRLAKADAPPPAEGSSPGGSPGSASPEGSSSSSSSGSPEGSAGIPGGDPSAAPPGGDPSAPPAGPPGADPSAAPPGADPSAAPPGAEGQAPAGPSFEELVSLYAALPPPDLEAHSAALQQAVAMKQGGAGAPPGAPPAGPPGASPSAAPPAGPPGASPSAPPFGKQEVATHNPNIGLAPGGGTPGHVETANPNIGPTKKSEADLLARLEKAEGDLAKFGEVVEKILTIPQRKAVTGLTIIPMAKKEAPIAPAKKNFDDLTKSELNVVLKTVTDPRNVKLTKSERDVITEYVLNPQSVDISAIKAIYEKV